MATFAQTISAGANDADERDDNTGFASTAVTVGAISNASAASRGNLGLRFANVTIPQAATITAATITVWVDGTKWDSPDCDILGEAADNPSDFATNADVTSRARTAASVSWTGTDIGTGSKTPPDITTVIQEIVNRAGWVSGNALVIFLDGRAASSNGVVIQSVENVAVHPASISISYTFPQTISATGIASTAAVGTHAVTSRYTATTTGIASTSAVGSPAVTSRNTINATGIASGAALGAPTVTPGAVTASPTSVASTSAIGAPTVSSLVTISPTSVASTAAVGAPTVTSRNTVTPAGITTTATVGTPTLTPGAVTISPTGIASTAAVGTPTLSSGGIIIAPVGIASNAAVGLPALSPGAVTRSPAGIASTATFGTVALTAGAVTITVTGIAATSTVGAASVTVTVPVPDTTPEQLRLDERGTLRLDETTELRVAELSTLILRGAR